MFHDRTYAAFLLEDRLRQYKDRKGVVVAIPRGGVPIGYQLAHLLHMPLDIIISKKIPHPFNDELAIGAVCDDEVVLDTDIGESISTKYVQQQVERLKDEAYIKYKFLNKNREPLPLKDKIVILVDDGIVTGNTVLAAIRSIRKQKPSKIVLAVPIASAEANRLLMPQVDEFICYRFLTTLEPWANSMNISAR
jgi:putative phosphoribosyl transferase